MSGFSGFFSTPDVVVEVLAGLVGLGRGAQAHRRVERCGAEVVGVEPELALAGILLVVAARLVDDADDLVVTDDGPAEVPGLLLLGAGVPAVEHGGAVDGLLLAATRGLVLRAPEPLRELLGGVRRLVDRRDPEGPGRPLPTTLGVLAVVDLRLDLEGVVPVRPVTGLAARVAPDVVDEDRRERTRRRVDLPVGPRLRARRVAAAGEHDGHGGQERQRDRRTTREAHDGLRSARA